MAKITSYVIKTFRCIPVFILCFGLNLQAKAKLDVQYVAVHFGNPEYSSVLDKSEFPGFQFYTAPGDVFGYTEEQKLIGNPTYLVGWYGEVPEKMGFCANYTVKKYFSRSHENGVAYVIDHNGVIAYQTLSEPYYPQDVWTDLSDKVWDDMKGAIKKMRKGKGAKPLKAKKCKYLKSSPVGELETVKKSKIDKDQKGLTGWLVPDLAIVDENGTATSLRAVAKDKVTVLVLYTLNGVHWKQGNKKGEIIAEWDGQKLINHKTYSERMEKRVMTEAEETGSATSVAKFVGRGLLKSGAAGGIGELAGELMSSKEELSDDDKVSAYTSSTSNLVMVSKIAKTIK